MKKFIIILLIFSFSLSLRFWNLDKMGRTWDERDYVEVGYKFDKLIIKGDILNNYFYEWVDEPPLARYIYGAFSVFDTTTSNNHGNVSFKYDYTHARIASALISSLSVIAVVLLAFEYISIFVGISAGIILSMLPIFLGFSQIATLESFLFFTFTISVYGYLRFLSKQSYKRAIVTGVFLGFAVLSKVTNLLLLPLFLVIYFIWKKYSVQKNKSITFKKFSALIISSLLTFFIVWPMPLFNLYRVINWNYELRNKLGSQPSIEVFFGRLIHVPVFYYFIFFLITTPVILLILFFLGSKYISDYGFKSDKLRSKFINTNSKWILYSLIAWFCLPFIQSFYNFRHQGIRFIIEIYAPFVLIAGIGLEYLANIFTRKIILKVILLVLLILYSLAILFKLTPYYLDYFNIAVGGNKNVYEKGLFQFGWWGQGLREAGYYLRNNASKASTVGLAVSPVHVFPDLPEFKVSQYNPQNRYDYVVVSYFHVLREGFDDGKIKTNYRLIYTVRVDGADLVWIYKIKN